MVKATIYITKFEEHLMKSWVPFSVHAKINYLGNNSWNDRRFECDEDTLSQVMYYINESDYNYNGERKGFLKKMQKAGKNVFGWT
jgi:hypothetical protein